MKLVAKTGREDIAMVYIAQASNGNLVEFVESIQPPLKREDKWVMIISTLYGCPVGCLFCDAGGSYSGKVSKDDMLFQIGHMIENRYPDGCVPAKKFKIQFARMGDPAFNMDVLEVLDELPDRYDVPGLIPSVSTIAPKGCDDFMERLLELKERRYQGSFQLQFSIHSTDQDERDRLVPVRKWSFEKIAEYGNRFVKVGDRKVTLNFALGEGMQLDPSVLLQHFDAKKFLIKITPVNPTIRAVEHGIGSHIVRGKDEYPVIEALRKAGYEVILSIGEWEENAIGSNCGQYIMNFKKALEEGKVPEENAYVYELEQLD